MAINALSLFGPKHVNNVEGIGGQNKLHGVAGRNPFAGGETGGIAGINGEVVPNVGDQGSSYTNGLGHSKHTINYLF